MIFLIETGATPHHCAWRHRIAIQGVLRTAREPAGLLEFEQAVDRLRLDAGRLPEPLRYPVGRGAEKALDFLGEQDKEESGQRLRE